VYALFFGPMGATLSAEVKQYGASLTGLVERAVHGLADAGLIDQDRSAACTASVRGLVAIYTMDFLYREVELDKGLSRRLVADLIEGFGCRSEPRSGVENTLNLEQGPD
jgi:hypothetical protein